MKWTASDAAPANARRVLPKLTRKFFKSGRKACEPGISHRELHGFRLKVKRYRYALEIFRPLYGPALEARLGVLQDLQQILGKMSDAFAIRDLVAEDAALARRLEDRGEKRIREFREFWTGTFDATGQEERWVGYLARYAGRKSPPSP